jgi:hypothetical protein
MKNILKGLMTFVVLSTILFVVIIILLVAGEFIESHSFAIIIMFEIGAIIQLYIFCAIGKLLRNQGFIGIKTAILLIIYGAYVGSGGDINLTSTDNQVVRDSVASIWFSIIVIHCGIILLFVVILDWIEKKEDAKNFYIDNDVVIDDRTGLSWQRRPFGERKKYFFLKHNAKKFTWNEAIELTDNKYGYSDWRLPAKDELMSLIYSSNSKCSKFNFVPPYEGQTMAKPTINTICFPNTPCGEFWSSSREQMHSSSTKKSPCCIDFSRGSSRVYSDRNTFFVRLVRVHNQFNNDWWKGDN